MVRERIQSASQSYLMTDNWPHPTAKNRAQYSKVLAHLNQSERHGRNQRIQTTSTKVNRCVQQISWACLPLVVPWYVMWIRISSYNTSTSVVRLDKVNYLWAQPGEPWDRKMRPILRQINTRRWGRRCSWQPGIIYHVILVVHGIATMVFFKQGSMVQRTKVHLTTWYWTSIKSAHGTLHCTFC